MFLHEYIHKTNFKLVAFLLRNLCLSLFSMSISCGRCGTLRDGQIAL